MFPPEKTAAITGALQQAFGVSTIEDTHAVTGATAANPVFRIVVRGCPYLLRLNQRAGDLNRQFACMRAASEAGLAPRVWFTSVEDRLCVTDFVNAVPFPADDALRLMPDVLRALHSLPPFPEAPRRLNTTCTYLLDIRTAQDGLIQAFRAANIVPKDEADDIFARCQRIAAAYPQDDAGGLSCHNDLFKPDNILYDGRRVWLVDWEAAFPNDPYADLAVVANMLVTNRAEQIAFLRQYFETQPNEYQLARFFLMRQLAHLFYGMIFLLQGSSGMQLDRSGPAPEFSEFQWRFWAGEIKLTDQETKTAYGRMHWERLAHNVRQTRFEESLRIVCGDATEPDEGRAGK